MEEERKQRLIVKLTRELGPLINEALADRAVIEIMLNPDGRIWIERLGGDMTPSGTMTATNAEALMATIATALNTTITRDNPIVEGELPIDGSRFEGLIPPVVAAPVFTIRKKASAVFPIAEYVRAGIMTAAQADLIREAVRSRKNIVIVGGTGSGKTTLGNAVLEVITEEDPKARLILIEDTVELQCKAANYVALRTSELVQMTRLLRATMRLRPNRIIVGEVRGAEAHPLIKAWNTGHPGGLATLHADDARGGLRRIEDLIREAQVQPNPEAIAAAVGLIVVIAKVEDRYRRVTEVVRVAGIRDTQYVLEAA